MFKLQSPSKYFPLDVIHPLRRFFHCSKVFEFVNLSILLPFSISAIFLFHLFYIGKTFLTEDFFSSRETKIKSCSGQDWVSREGGARGSCHFWSKTAEHSVQCGQVCSYITPHEMGKGIGSIFTK